MGAKADTEIVPLKIKWVRYSNIHITNWWFPCVFSGGAWYRIAESGIYPLDDFFEEQTDISEIQELPEGAEIKPNPVDHTKQLLGSIEAAKKEGERTPACPLCNKKKPVYFTGEGGCFWCSICKYTFTFSEEELDR